MSRRQLSRQSTQPSKHLFSHYFRIIFSLSCIIIIGLFVLFLALFRQSYGWKDEKNILIVPSVIDGSKSPILLAHIIPQSQRIEVFSFPNETVISLIGGYGKYPLRSVYPLLHLDHKDAQFIRAAYTFGFNELIDQVWATPQAQSFADASQVKQFLTSVAFSPLSTPLNIFDKIWLMQFTHSLDVQQIEISSPKDLTQWATMQDKVQFPSLAADCPISIVNTTGVSGVGGKVASVLEKSGFSLLRVADDDHVEAKSTIYVGNSQQKCAAVLAHLPALFPQAVSIRKDIQKTIQFRSEIVIFLGKESSDVLKEK